MEMVNIYKQYIAFKLCLTWNIYIICNITIVLHGYHLMLPFRLVFIIITASRTYRDKSRKKKFRIILYLLTNSLPKLEVSA